LCLEINCIRGKRLFPGMRLQNQAASGFGMVVDHFGIAS
jgi:hypothetical protein